MKSHVILTTLLALALPAWGHFSIDWFTIDGGGGTSTGGMYAVTGTMPMTGGPYSLTGGFWAIHAIQTPGAPFLTITLNHQLSTAELSWSPDTSGWVLQETLSLSPAAWTDSPSGSTNPITVPVAMPTTFYRLHKP